jgi:hypothetical protein
MAPSRQLVLPPGLGVLVVDGSGVGDPVGGIWVETVRPGLVGGRVEVTKRGGAGVAVSIASVETFTQEVNSRTNRRQIRIFFMWGFYFEI